VTRGITAVEGGAGGFAALYRVLSAMEESGKARRGYFVEGLGAAQFASGNAVDLLRAPTSRDPRSSRVLAATDPANPFGAALPWPGTANQLGHHPGRKAGATVVIDAEGLAMFIERGGRSLLTWVEAQSDRASAATSALVAAVRSGRRPELHVERVNGDSVHQTPWPAVLSESGFAVTPRGLRVRHAR
jgi:ATP-dependent Lhr-like helicase